MRERMLPGELYRAARGDPSLRSITESWMATSRDVSHRYVDPVTALGLDTLIKGSSIHSILATGPPSHAQSALFIDRAIGSATRVNRGMEQPS